MAEESADKVKVELELPKEEVHVEPQPEPLKAAQKLGEAREKVRQKMKEVEKKEEKLKQKEEELDKKEKKQKKGKEDGEEDEIESKKTVAGYKLGELAKAPVEPPEPENTKAPTNHQKTVMAFGGVLVIIGVIAWPVVSLVFGIAIMIAGALVIAFSALVRI